MKVEETEIKSSNCEKLLGIKIDDKLSFNLYYIIDKANRNTNALSRVAPCSYVPNKREGVGVKINEAVGDLY